MNLVLDRDKYDIDNVFFYDPVKNTVMDDSIFIRIIYSNEHIILNGIYFNVNLNINNMDKELNFLQMFEENLLNGYDIGKRKIHIKKIKEHLMYLIKKIYNDNINIKYLLKISGIWEGEHNIGLTFKFIFQGN